ncbi:MAG: 6,7-dimethyl-8-ribityllumazine synthase [Gemmatimonadales bacterium]
MVDDNTRNETPAADRVLVAVSRYNEGVTRKLLDGARAAIGEEGVTDDLVDVVWVPGAFELPLAVSRAFDTGRYRFAVALGAVIRGETPHFDYVSDAATQGLGATALEYRLPVGFGLLTCDTLAQAMARAGGEAGNKGEEAARSAFETERALEVLGG